MQCCLVGREPERCQRRIYHCNTATARHSVRVVTGYGSHQLKGPLLGAQMPEKPFGAGDLAATVAALRSAKEVGPMMT